MKGKVKDPANDTAHFGKSAYATRVREGRQMYGGFMRRIKGHPKGGPTMERWFPTKEERKSWNN